MVCEETQGGARGGELEMMARRLGEKMILSRRELVMKGKVAAEGPRFDAAVLKRLGWRGLATEGQSGYRLS